MKVSVIIPNYNTAHYLRDAVESVLGSNFEDYEIIVVDDGSKDNTPEVVALYSKLLNFKCVYQENKGLSGARNTGIEIAKGEYLVFLDSDDVLLPNKLREQSKFLDDNPQYDAVYSDTVCFRENDLNDLVSVTLPTPTGNILSNLLDGNFMHVDTLMVRKSAVDSVNWFDPNLRELEDWDLWLRMSINGSKFGYVDELLSKHRIRRDSMITNQNKMNIAMVNVLKKNIKLIQNDPLLSAKKPLIAKAYHTYYELCLKANIREGFIGNLFGSYLQLGNIFLVPFLKMLAKYYPYKYFKPTSPLSKVYFDSWKTST